MSAELFSLAMGEISDRYIEEALTYQAPVKKHRAKSFLRVTLAACLAIIMALGTAMAVSAEFREAVFGWFKEQYQSFIHYEYRGAEEDHESDTEIADIFIPHVLTEVPPGFVIRDSTCDEDVGHQHTIYWNEEKGQQCIVVAIAGHESTGNLFVEEEGYTIHPVEVAGVIGDLYIPDDPTNDGVIIWMKDHMLFYIAAHFTPEELVYYAERLQPAPVQEEEAAHYQLGFVPEGYTFLTENRSPHDHTILYSNEAGRTLSFLYIWDPDGGEAFIKSGDTQVTTTIHGAKADLMLSSDLSKEGGSIVWTEDEILFSISACLTEDELIALAESVKEVPVSEMEGET